MEEAIQAFDWNRMLVGDAPLEFLFEIAFRTIIIYVYCLALLRWLGSRTIGQLSTIEFLLVIALGSAVGDSMFYPDVPLLHALLVITMVVLANKALDLFIAKSARAEIVIDGVPEEAIRDGVVCKAFIASTTFSQSELFQQLRRQGVENLGEVARAYVETNGGLSIFLAKNPKPGLPIVPPWEIDPPKFVKRGTTLEGSVGCKQCGMVTEVPTDCCSHCGYDVWVEINK
ncbi:DUF421 domain-containing protein [Rhizobium sp. LjRoot98]|uniref:DUF421 domain-containing protein n=1 Tax=unclassified Rhizobium TaxID=2613769 RepID=UPI000714604C|nr:YetF domain-containing protein [Rhizobium sp. Root1204]KQV41612.1 hypothetical protein ASC96_17590 [Rhizobium sp. Root1204]